jgi:hypothetical protein
MPWFRFYTEAITDRKVRRLSPAQRWVWTAVMAAARESPVPGRLMVTESLPMTLPELADYADVREREVTAAVDLMVRLVMLHWDGDVMVVTNWPKRQPESDNVTERSRKHRAKPDGNGVATLQQQSLQRVSNAPEVEREIETRSTSVELIPGGHRHETLGPPDATQPPRCVAHRGLPEDQVPPCRGCMVAGEKSAGAAETTTAAQALSCRMAIDNCGRCDDNGFIEDPVTRDPIARCDHRPVVSPPVGGPVDTQPETRTA